MSWRVELCVMLAWKHLDILLARNDVKLLGKMQQMQTNVWVDSLDLSMNNFYFVKLLKSNVCYIPHLHHNH